MTHAPECVNGRRELARVKRRAVKCHQFIIRLGSLIGWCAK